MLRTALKPVWLATLVLALVAAAVFVALSKWQFESAETNAPPTATGSGWCHTVWPWRTRISRMSPRV